MTGYTLHGGCDCGAVRYRIEGPPMIVHCCHCRWCQRESGASFALNAMIEGDRLINLGVEPEYVLTPSESGAGQTIARCPTCRLALWSYYSSAGPVIAFIRVGTLETPDALPPDVHIFAASKQPWVVLGTDTPVFEAYYDRKAVWSPEALARHAALKDRIATYRQTREGG